MRRIKRDSAFQQKRNERYLAHYTAQLSSNGNYHNHKERMAYVGFALELAFAAAFLTSDAWPPNWAEHWGINLIVLFAIWAPILVWYLFHVFLRWQLRNRRTASYLTGAANRVVRDLIIGPGKGFKFGTQQEDARTKYDNKWRRRFDFFWWPINSRTLRQGTVGETVQFVDYLKKEYEQPGDSGNEAMYAEWLVTLGSLLIGLGVLAKVWTLNAQISDGLTILLSPPVFTPLQMTPLT